MDFVLVTSRERARESFMSSSFTRERNWIVANSNTTWLEAFEKSPLPTIDMTLFISMKESLTASMHLHALL